jgi:hypothetical protein
LHYSIYLQLQCLRIPAASELDTLGIIGFVLMLMTETLYSFRNAAERPLGTHVPMVGFAIFTGIIILPGAAALILKSMGWLASSCCWTVVIVISGFIKRISTLPYPHRGWCGSEVNLLEQQIKEADVELQKRLSADPEAAHNREQRAELDRLRKRRQTLQRQVNSLATTRRSLALWHSIHIPIGMALFTAAFIHVLAAIYYATLLR